MINNDESRGNTNQPGRRPTSPKSHTYSPSSSYNYNHSNNYSGNGYNSNYNNYNGQSQHPRRRTFKPLNYSDKIVKQNDMIIKLLKEIRDRLPAPIGSVTGENDEAFEREDRTELMDSNNENTVDEEGMMEHSSEDNMEHPSEDNMGHPSEDNCDTEFEQENSPDEFDEMNRK